MADITSGIVDELTGNVIYPGAEIETSTGGVLGIATHVIGTASPWPSYTDKIPGKSSTDYTPDISGYETIPSAPNVAPTGYKEYGYNMRQYDNYVGVENPMPYVTVKKGEYASDITDGCKIQWPRIQTGQIFGLPPAWAMSDDMYIEDTSLTEDIMRMSFPLLRVVPLELKMKGDSSSFSAYNVNKLANYTYVFACRPEGDVGYSHRNTYAESSIENVMQQAASSNIARELHGLMQVSSLGIAQQAKQAGNQLQDMIKKTFEVMGEAAARNGASGTTSDTSQSLMKAGNDLVTGLLSGGRVDMPNIWQNSDTSLSWSFNIKLRTMANSVEDQQYIDEIITPLEILMKLSLPIGGKSIGYLDPPYISAQMGNILDVKLGAISSINVSFPLSEMNLFGVIREVNVMVSIEDLYKVMVQETGDDEVELPSLNKVLNMIKKNNNEDMLLGSKERIVEFYKYMYAVREAETETVPTNNYSAISNEILQRAIEDDYNNRFPLATRALNGLETIFRKIKGTETAADKIHNLPEPGSVGAYIQLVKEDESNRSVYLVKGSPTIASIPRVTSITGNIDLTNLLIKPGSVYNICPSRLTTFSINANATITTDTPEIMETTIKKRLGDFLNDKNELYIWTENVTTIKPNRIIDRLGYVCKLFIDNMLTNGKAINEWEYYSSLIAYPLYAIGKCSTAIINDLEITEETFRAFVTQGLLADTSIANKVKLSKDLTDVLEQLITLFYEEMIQHSDTESDFKAMHNSMPAVSNTDFGIGMDKLMAIMFMLSITSMQEAILIGSEDNSDFYCNLYIQID